jgi:hypothetical protein
MDATYINSKPLLEPVQTDERYQQNLKNFLLQKPDSNTLNNSSFMPWSSTIQQTQPNFVDVLGSELDMATLIDQPVWPLGQFNSQAPNVNDSFDAFNNLFAPWSSNMQVPPTIKEEWGTNNIPLGLPSQAQEHIPIQSIPFQQQHQQQFMFPPTPPVSSPGSYVGQHYIEAGMNKGLEFNSDYPIQFTREPTPPPSSSNSGNNSPNSAISTPPMSYYAPSKITHQRATMRRRSTESHHPTPTRSYRRRASSHPSVASVVSLSAHEPVARVIDGIEYITFLYSHERLVKEYTVRTDIENVSLESIPIGFRVQNAVS